MKIQISFPYNFKKSSLHKQFHKHHQQSILHYYQQNQNLFFHITKLFFLAILSGYIWQLQPNILIYQIVNIIFINTLSG